MTTPMARVEVLRAACCVAGADGTVDDDERKLIDDLAEKVGVGRASLDAMVLRAETEPDFYENQFRVLKIDPGATMSLMFEVASQNRKIDPNEMAMLQHFAKRLGMDEASFKEVFAATVKNLDTVSRRRCATTLDQPAAPSTKLESTASADRCVQRKRRRSVVGLGDDRKLACVLQR